MLHIGTSELLHNQYLWPNSSVSPPSIILFPMSVSLCPLLGCIWSNSFGALCEISRNSVRKTKTLFLCCLIEPSNYTSGSTTTSVYNCYCTSPRNFFTTVLLCHFQIFPSSVCVSHCHVQLFATPWTIDCQAPPSMVFSRQEYWNGLPFPSPVKLSTLSKFFLTCYLPTI